MFIKSTLRRLGRDLQSLVRIIEMLVAEAERRQERDKARRVRREVPKAPPLE